MKAKKKPNTPYSTKGGCFPFTKKIAFKFQKPDLVSKGKNTKRM